ncbi:hypothetical protein [Desulfovulcanus sp.]
MFSDKDIQGMYDHKGNLMGVFISPKLWQAIEDEVNPIIDKYLGPSEEQEVAPVMEEPIADWENFLNFWDFRYPVEKKVVCHHCGSETSDWTTDHPKKFLLKAANIAGLVTFQCLQCKARIIKRHFKDHIKYEAIPYNED